MTGLESVDWYRIELRCSSNHLDGIRAATKRHSSGTIWQICIWLLQNAAPEPSDAAMCRADTAAAPRPPSKRVVRPSLEK